MGRQETNKREELIRFVDAANKKIWLNKGTPDFNVDELLQEAETKAFEADYTFGKGQCALNKAMGAYVIHQNTQLGFQYLDEALAIFHKCDNSKWIANTHSIAGIFNNSAGHTDTALYHALRGYDYYERHPEDDEDGTMSYYVLGTVYKDLKKYGEAEDCYLKGIQREDKNRVTWKGRVHTGLASLYGEIGKLELALTHSFESARILELEQNIVAMSRVYNDIGIIYRKLKNYDLALSYLNRGLEIRQKYKLKAFLFSSYMEIAGLYIEIGSFDKAILELQKAELNVKETAQSPKLARIYEQFMLIYKKTGNFPEALDYSEKLLAINEEINRQEMETRISILNTSFQKEKEDEIERLRTVELKKAYELIDQKNKDITDSIKYAKRIQQAILPSEKYIQKSLERLSGKQL
ncbi:MAG: hypothetical protein K0Q95_2323 [Bacteroidota bacterium]|nr:hypothetical protein [Bacteroidota bacterium]